MMLSDKAQSSSGGVMTLKSIDNSSGLIMAMFVDYVVENSNGGFRAGTLRSTHKNGVTTWDDTSTADVGGSTNGFRLSTDISGTDFRLRGDNTDASTYNIIFSIKLILK